MITVSGLLFLLVKTGRGIHHTLVICPDKRGKHKLYLKVDTRASGNALQLRIKHQMYGPTQWKPLAKPVNVTLRAYNGTSIKRLGAIELMCRRQSSSRWRSQLFYIVDVPGPAVVGLPTCDSLRFVTTHCVIDQKQKFDHPAIRDIYDLVKLYPDRFDTTGNFRKAAKLHLKENAKPFIDPPRKDRDVVVFC